MIIKRKRKTKVRFYTFKGLKCQGRKELRYLKECIRYNWPLPIKPKRVETPFGFYTPDFEYEEMYIEIKSKGTFSVMMGEIAYKGIGKKSNLQWKKICWVNENVKPVNIRIYLGKRDTLINLPDYNLNNVAVKQIGGYKKKK